MVLRQAGAMSGALARRPSWLICVAVGSAARGSGLVELGAAEVVVGLADVSEPFFGVLDNVGGSLLAETFSLVGEGGSLAVHRNGVR